MDFDELNEGFQIDNDNLADWAIKKIKEEEAERDRVIAIAKDQIEELNFKINNINEQCENKTRFLRGCLNRYFETVPHKETKTQESYKLLSGSLVLKKPSQKITYNEENLLSYLDQNDGAEFIKTKRSVDWTEFKKSLIIQGDSVIDKDLGLILDSGICSVEEVPASFNVKF